MYKQRFTKAGGKSISLLSKNLFGRKFSLGKAVEKNCLSFQERIDERKRFLVIRFWRAWIVFPLVPSIYKTKGTIGVTKKIFHNSMFIVYLTARLVIFQKNAEEVQKKSRKSSFLFPKLFSLVYAVGQGNQAKSTETFVGIPFGHKKRNDKVDFCTGENVAEVTFSWQSQVFFAH